MQQTTVQVILVLAVFESFFRFRIESMCVQHSRHAFARRLSLTLCFFSRRLS